MRSRRVRRQTVRMRQRRARQHRIRRIVGLLALAAVLLVTLLLTAFGTGQSRAPRATTGAGASAPARRASAATGRRHAGARCRSSSLCRRSACPRSATTRPATARCRSSRSAGRRTRGLRRLVHRVFGGGRREAPLLPAGRRPGPPTGSLDVGAPAGHGRLRAGRRHGRRPERLRPRRRAATARGSTSSRRQLRRCSSR